jgi:PadR family transcriptional regulator, regulatory protein AphA
MSLEHAILGFLNYGPFSGYDLKKVFDTSVQHFWPADQSQIYRTLARLEEQGLTEVEVVHQEGRPDRKEYHITPAGQEALHQWLATPLPPEEIRSAALIQIFFAGQLSDEEILSGLEERAERTRKLLDHYSEVPEASSKYAQDVHSPREVFFWMLTLECGIKSAQTQLEWLEDVIERIRNKQHPSEKKEREKEHYENTSRQRQPPGQERKHRTDRAALPKRRTGGRR